MLQNDWLTGTLTAISVRTDGLSSNCEMIGVKAVMARVCMCKDTVKFSVQTPQLPDSDYSLCVTTYFAETCHQLASLSLSRFPTLS